MAFFKFNNVRIAGISGGVPSSVINNAAGITSSDDYDAQAFIETTGVAERRVSPFLTASDLCYEAAEKLLTDLQWNKEEIDILVFVTQTPDYCVPATACIMQDRLGLSKNCYAEDISLGCSGWVYGLSNVASLLENGDNKKALLMVGDGKRRSPEEDDPLFGWAGVVTALEYQENSSPLMFHFGTDGGGFDAIIIPDGGCRYPVSSDSFKYEDIEGHKLNKLQTHMKGMDVFSFGISTAPKSVKKLAEHYEFEISEYDYLLLHQANMKMNNMIAKKLKFDKDKVPSSMYHFGNTSSASIPLTIVTELKDKAATSKKILCCGFGVGLSWGTVALTIDNIVISDLVEVTDNKTDKIHVI
ncbi:MAG: ketoacyl-ACP synthase III [Bacteroidetes bacterium]|nr:ketoacyl-ACP synthase III [Bacteroidota bacterium]